MVSLSKLLMAESSLSIFLPDGLLELWSLSSSYFFFLEDFFLIGAWLLWTVCEVLEERASDS